jgi:hypothetical protein
MNHQQPILDSRIVVEVGSAPIFPENTTTLDSFSTADPANIYQPQDSRLLSTHSHAPEQLQSSLPRPSAPEERLGPSGIAIGSSSTPVKCEHCSKVFDKQHELKLALPQPSQVIELLLTNYQQTRAEPHQASSVRYMPPRWGSWSSPEERLRSTLLGSSSSICTGT